MKKLTAILMALAMAGSPGLAMADRGKHHGDRRGDYHQGYQGKHHGKHDYKHYRHPGKRYGHSARHPVYHHYWPHYRTRIYYGHDPYLPLGAALVGTAIGYSLSQSGPDCSASCGTTSYLQRAPTNVSGCYRIERYPDGSERRVDLPPSQCF